MNRFDLGRCHYFLIISCSKVSHNVSGSLDLARILSRFIFRGHKVEKTPSGRKERTTYSPYKEKAEKILGKSDIPNKQKIM